MHHTKMDNSTEPQTQNENIEIFMEDYLSSLNAKELKAYHIAKSHLGMSFDLQKSNGFLEFMELKGKNT
jgi:hypothetical protein